MKTPTNFWNIVFGGASAAIAALALMIATGKQNKEDGERAMQKAIDNESRLCSLEMIQRSGDCWKRFGPANP